MKLWTQDGALAYSCTCPIGSGGDFCKHCVAVGLAWLSGGPPASMDDARAALASQPKESLIALLLEHAMEDDRLRQKLLLKAAKKSNKGIDLRAYRSAIDEAVDPGRFVDYHDAPAYAQGVEEAVEPLEDLLKEGHAAAVIELSEHALKAVEDALDAVDDDGLMGAVLERLQELHLAACRQARPDPQALAQRLFQWELDTPYETFYGAVNTYADVLGGKGLAAYRTLAEAAWAQVPARASRDKGRFSDHFRITHIMECLAQRDGDVEALVKIKRRDLSSAFSYLEIAEAYKAARKHDQALAWAEKGRAAFPKRTDSRLREFLAQEYHRRKRHAEALELIWAKFTDYHDLENYKSLKAHADRAGDWPRWRDKALAFIRAREGRSILVAIYLWEGRTEDAWRQAKQGGCAEDLWLELARLREKDHPQDALAVYQARVEPALDQTNDEGYRSAVAHLRKVRALMGRLGRSEEFSRYLASTRAAFKRKRNFIKLLDRALPA